MHGTRHSVTDGLVTGGKSPDVLGCGCKRVSIQSVQKRLWSRDYILCVSFIQLAAAENVTVRRGL